MKAPSRSSQPGNLANNGRFPYRADVAGRKKKRAPDTVGRYDLREITARVDKLRRQRSVPAKVIYADLGMDRWDWSRKVRQAGSSFTIEELGRIADLLDAPAGWPFIPD
jgi:hypothetical protein